MNMTHWDAYRLPVAYRRWYIERLVRDIEKRNQIAEESSRERSQPKRNDRDIFSSHPIKDSVPRKF